MNDANINFFADSIEQSLNNFIDRIKNKIPINRMRDPVIQLLKRNIHGNILTGIKKRL
jgi:hypothetical protein